MLHILTRFPQCFSIGCNTAPRKHHTEFSYASKFPMSKYFCQNNRKPIILPCHREQEPVTGFFSLGAQFADKESGSLSRDDKGRERHTRWLALVELFRAVDMEGIGYLVSCKNRRGLGFYQLLEEFSHDQYDLVSCKSNINYSPV